ncbi:MAG: hypothetical protein WEA56_03520 [Balneolaceae bacterium]
MNKNGIDTYIIQLAEQMRTSAKNLPDPNVMSEFDEESLPDELKMFADVERYLHGTAKKLSIITGIKTEAFPPAEKLNETQIDFLVDEINRLLHAYCFCADFPKGLPASLKYELLLEKWNDKAVYTGEGMSHFEFCHYEPEECPFPEEFCGCKEFLDDGE